MWYVEHIPHNGYEMVIACVVIHASLKAVHFIFVSNFIQRTSHPFSWTIVCEVNVTVCA